ncbi:class F sortase [Sporosarcina sp. CAU 1771]
MKNHLLIGVLFILGLLSGCAQEVSTEVVQQERVTQPEQTTTSETAQEVAALPSSEGLSLADKRVGIEPARLEIPKLKVDAVIEGVGRIENGQMGVPQNPDNIGWFEPGIKPGAQGNAVMAGHIDSATGPAVFHKLEKLEKGDEIVVHGKNDEKIRFIVTKTEAYPRNDSPVEAIFGFNYSSGLTLITCTGEYNRTAKTHEERFVVYTELVGE